MSVDRLVPWGAASLAAHLVLIVLSAMSQIVRTVEGESGKPGVAADSPSFVSAQSGPPEFRTDPPSIDPARFEAAPPTPEIRWSHEGESVIASGPALPKPDADAAVVRSGRDAEIRVGRPADRREGGSPGSGAVLAALRWLARHQSPDGTWEVRGYTRRCHKECLPSPGADDFDVGVTGLALLAFSRAGYTPASGEVHDGVSFGAVMRKAVEALVSRQDREGCIGSRIASKYMYNHIFATLALAEATRHSSHVRQEVRDAANFLIRARNPGKGWRYSNLCGDNDSSVTGWAVLALRAAEPFSDGGHGSSYRGAISWFDDVTSENYGRVGYMMRDT